MKSLPLPVVALCSTLTLGMLWPTPPSQAMDMIPFLGGGEEGKEETEEEKVEVSAEPVYVQIENITAPVYFRDKIRHHILFTMNLETTGQATKNEIVRLMPRLRDAMLRDLYTDPISTEKNSERVDIIAIKERMYDVAKRVLGAERVVDILIVKTARTG